MKGIEGKKGVLWWQIYETLKAKRPPYVLLENVDRLLSAPSYQRGQAFAIILRTLTDLGYGVEWETVDASEWGFPQARKRVYIFAFREGTRSFEGQKRLLGMIQRPNKDISRKRYAEVADLSEKYNQGGFEAVGYCIEGKTFEVPFNTFRGTAKTLGDILVDDAPESAYRIDTDKFAYLKGKKKLTREKNGIAYTYSEGAIPFPDPLNRPSRTILTSEGGTNRMTHIVRDPHTQRLRRLTPTECERLDGFPDGWTEGMTERRRYFVLGNALVCGVIEHLGEKISKVIEAENRRNDK